MFRGRVHPSPSFVDAATLGSYAYRRHWIWTNMACSATLTSSLSHVSRPPRRWIDDILDDHSVSTEVTKDDKPPLAMVNRGGFTRRAFPTLMSYSGSFAFCAGGLRHFASAGQRDLCARRAKSSARGLAEPQPGLLRSPFSNPRL